MDRNVPTAEIIPWIKLPCTLAVGEKELYGDISWFIEPV